MRNRLAFTLLLVSVFTATAVTPAMAAPASAPATSHATAPAARCGLFHKAAVILKLGAAIGVFHHWIYKPWKKGEFEKGAKGRVKTIVKAVIAAYAAWKLARSAITSMEKCGTGKKIVALLDAIKGKLLGLKKTKPSTSTASVNTDVSSMNSAWSTIKSDEHGL